MTLNTQKRSQDPEIMDDFSLEGEVLREALDKIAKINLLLGGNKLTVEGVKKLLLNIHKEQEIVIVDIGCGNGDMLRTLANYAQENLLKFKLIGIDANKFTINYARKLSKNYLNISFLCEDIFDKSFTKLNYDIILCTLTLHHFKDREINQLLNIFNSNSRIGIVINDLHRSAIAYRLFQGLCIAFRLNTMSREDGLVSIKRGFKKVELEEFSKELNLKKYTIRWKWAFRYQWIISKF